MLLFQVVNWKVHTYVGAAVFFSSQIGNYWFHQFQTSLFHCTSYCSLCRFIILCCLQWPVFIYPTYIVFPSPLCGNLFSYVVDLNSVS
jgi:hypothetical protein